MFIWSNKFIAIVQCMNNLGMWDVRIFFRQGSISVQYLFWPCGMVYKAMNVIHRGRIISSPLCNKHHHLAVLNSHLRYLVLVIA